MLNKLELILLQKQKEVANLYRVIARDPKHPLATILREHYYARKIVDFKQALNASSLAVIAEIKRRSPSKGNIGSIKNPVDFAQRYIESGANAISVLTDEVFFGGNLNDLIQVAGHAATKKIPVLRKDFIIDMIQIAETALAGASAVLLIVAILGLHTKSLLAFARALQLDVLVEVHDDNELQIAMSAGADIIGINNRNLQTFVVNTEHAFTLSAKIPEHILKVAESGITQAALAKRYYAAGFKAVLIGETLVQSADPKQFIVDCRHE